MNFPKDLTSTELDLQPALRQMHQWGLDNGDLGYAYWHDIAKLLVSAQDFAERIRQVEAELASLHGANKSTPNGLPRRR